MHSDGSREIYNRNMAALLHFYEGSTRKILANEYSVNDEITVESETSYTDQTILEVTSLSGEKRYLAGKYAPEQPLKDWIEKQGRIEFGSVFFIIGMGNIWSIKRIIQELNEQVLFVIYEPSIEVFLEILKNYDITDLIENSTISILVEGINSKFMETVFSKVINYDNMVLTKVYVSGNYSELFPNETHDAIKRLKKYLENVQVAWNTALRFTNVVGNNVLNNIAYFYHGYSMKQFYNIMPSEVPAIVVSAGPSLNKNIDDLKNAVGKACIIATDTALKPLLNHGIKPDFVAIVDGKKPADLLRHEKAKDVFLLTSTVVSKNAMNFHQGKKVFYYGGSPYEEDVVKYINRKKRVHKLEIPPLPTGGSVATSAFSFALYMGAKTIILVGQDLALTGNKTHADGTFQEKMDTINTDSPIYFPIESVDGGTVYSRSDFKLYLEWFERRIKDLDDEVVIDATEGGAKIHGTEIMTLRDAIRQHCTEEWNLEEIADQIPEMLSEYDKSQLLNCFQNTVSQLYQVKKKAQEGIHHYEKMLSLCKRKEFNEQKFYEISKKVKKINSYMNTNLTALFVISNLQGLEYTMRASIYITEEDEKDERVAIAKQGLFILQNIHFATEEMISRVEDMLMPYQGDDKLLYDRYSEADSKLII